MTGSVKLSERDAALVLGARDALRSLGSKTLVASLERSFLVRPGPPAIVVVGEVKRGKSTLVQALAGVTGSPTGVEHSTPAVVAIVPPDDDLPEGEAVLDLESGRAVRLSADEARDALAAGTYDDEVIVRCRIAASSAWVPDAVFIDTPGVGGLATAHTRRAIMAAAEAAALVFVSDSGQTLTKPEVEFLRAISARVEHVALVLTKVDLNPAGWERVVEANRALIREHAPRFADVPIFPVSAALAVHAAGQPAEVARELEVVSGIPRLAEALRAMVGNRDRLHTVNVLRAAESAMARVQARLDMELSAARRPEGLEHHEARVLVINERIAEVKLLRRRGKYDLDRDLRRLRRTAITGLQDQAREIEERLAAQLKRSVVVTRASYAEFINLLQAELENLADETFAILRSGLTDLVEEATGSQAQPPPGLPDDPVDAGLELRVVDRRTGFRERLTDPSQAMLLMIASNALRALEPISMTLGSAMIGVHVVGRRRQELSRTLKDSVSQARGAITNGIDAWLDEWRPELYLGLEDFLGQSMEELKVMREAATQDAAERRQRLESAERRMRAVQSRREALSGRIAALRAAVKETSQLPEHS